MNPIRLFAPKRRSTVRDVVLTIDKPDGSLRSVHVRLLAADADKVVRRVRRLSATASGQGRDVVMILSRPGRRPLITRHTVSQPGLDKLLAFISEADR